MWYHRKKRHRSWMKLTACLTKLEPHHLKIINENWYKEAMFFRKYTSSNEIPKLTVNEPDRILVYSGKKKNNYVA